MSMDPNYNPYTSIATPEQPAPFCKQPIRGFVKIVCIFFIVFGTLGLLGTMQAIGGLVMVLMMDENQFNPMRLFPGAMAITIMLGIVNFIVSVFEIAGGVLGLQQKRLGAKLIRFVSGFMLVFKVAETAYISIVNFLSIGPVIEQSMKQMPNQPAGGPDLGMIVQIGMYVGIGFVIASALVMFTFYLFSFLAFSKQKTLSQFS